MRRSLQLRRRTEMTNDRNGPHGAGENQTGRDQSLRQLSAAESMLLGLVAKSLASLLTYPLLVAKVRMQTMGRANANANASANANTKDRPNSKDRPNGSDLDGPNGNDLDRPSSNDLDRPDGKDKCVGATADPHAAGNAEGTKPNHGVNDSTNSIRATATNHHAASNGDGSSRGQRQLQPPPPPQQQQQRIHQSGVVASAAMSLSKKSGQLGSPPASLTPPTPTKHTLTGILRQR